MRNVLATIAGLVDAFILVFIFDMLAHIVFPIEGDTPTSLEEMLAIIDKIPTGQFVLMGVGHFIAIVAGMGLATLIAKKSLVPAIIVGGLVSVATLANLFMLPHPNLFIGIEVGAILLGLAIGWFITKRVVKQ